MIVGYWINPYFENLMGDVLYFGTYCAYLYATTNEKESGVCSLNWTCIKWIRRSVILNSWKLANGAPGRVTLLQPYFRARSVSVTQDSDS